MDVRISKADVVGAEAAVSIAVENGGLASVAADCDASAVVLVVEQDFEGTGKSRNLEAAGSRCSADRGQIDAGTMEWSAVFGR